MELWGERKHGLGVLISVMHNPWHSESKRRVRPAVVIQMHALHGCLAGLPFGFESRIQPVFLFQNPINPLRQRILGAVILLRHAHPQTGLLHPLDVRVRRILAPAVRVVDRALASLEPAQSHG